jgi:hypothetical protein
VTVAEGRWQLECLRKGRQARVLSQLARHPGCSTWGQRVTGGPSPTSCPRVVGVEEFTGVVLPAEEVRRKRSQRTKPLEQSGVVQKRLRFVFLEFL